MALTSYEVGYALGSVVVFGTAGALLLRSGLRAQAGGGRTWAGVALLALGFLGSYGGAIGTITRDQRADEVRIAFPGTVLGLARHDSYVPPAVEEGLKRAGEAFEQLGLAYYGPAFGGLLTVAGRGGPSGAQAASSFFAGFAEAGKVGTRQQTTPATKEGQAECATVALPVPDGLPVERFACFWSDDRAVLATVDGEAKDLTDAAKRGRVVHSLVVRRASDPAPDSSAPDPTPPVVFSLPGTISGYKQDVKAVVRDEISFNMESSRFASSYDLALYVNGRGQGFLVQGLVSDLSSHEGLVRQFRRDLQELGKDPGAPTVVTAGGPRPGKGYCWRVTVEKIPSTYCLLADDVAYVAVLELGSTDVAGTAALSRQVRAIGEKPNP